VGKAVQTLLVAEKKRKGGKREREKFCKGKSFFFFLFLVKREQVDEKGNNFSEKSEIAIKFNIGNH